MVEGAGRGGTSAIVIVEGERKWKGSGCCLMGGRREGKTRREGVKEGEEGGRKIMVS